MIKIQLLTLALLSVVPFLAGCKNEQESIPASLRGYNHTDKGLLFTVNDQGGAYISSHSGGGEYCCIGIPKSWSEGMHVNVEWKWSGTETWHKREVPVPEYGGTGGVSVHFLRNGEIKVFATMYGLQHPDYPLKGDEASLYPPGESPDEIWEAAKTGNDEQQISAHIAEMRRSGGVGIGIQHDVLKRFVRQQLEVAKSYGISEMDDQQKFLLLAMFTSGKFVEHPVAKEALRQASKPGAFSAWATNVPDEVFDGSHTFAETLRAADKSSSATTKGDPE